MKVVVFGAQGQVGMAALETAKRVGSDVAGFSHQACDIRDPGAIKMALQSVGTGDIVINAAARLGTEEAQHDPSAQFETNVQGAMLVALAARRAGAAIVHFSTDYVFDGTKPTAYVESDLPNPVNAYGALKLASEAAVCAANPQHYILRIASAFGQAERSSKGLNFVDRMLQATRSNASVEVDDVITMSPTFAVDAVAVAFALVQRAAPFTVYHAANAGACTWREFAAAIFTLAGLSCEARARVSSVDPIPRPRNSALTSERLPALGIATPPWRDALARYLASKR